MHHSLIFKSVQNKGPSFYEIDIKNPIHLNKCICSKFKRTMKYLMKGFYYQEEQLISGIQKAKELEPKIINPKQKTCNFCSKLFL